MFELKVISHFAAAHQLKMVAKKCENMHGHNWKIEVCVAGKDLNNAGVIMDFAKIKEYVYGILEKLDHKEEVKYTFIARKTVESKIDPRIVSF